MQCSACRVLCVVCLRPPLGNLRTVTWDGLARVCVRVGSELYAVVEAGYLDQLNAEVQLTTGTADPHRFITALGGAHALSVSGCRR